MHYLTTMIFSYIYRFFRFFFVFLFSLFCQQHAHASCLHFPSSYWLFKHQLPTQKTPPDEDQKIEMRRGLHLHDKITTTHSVFLRFSYSSYITNRTNNSSAHHHVIPFVFHTNHVTYASLQYNHPVYRSNYLLHIL